MMLLSFVLLYFVCNIKIASFFAKNNVCTDFSAYANIKKSKKCYYNPDMDSSPREIVRQHGFSLEDHLVTTKDGYILTIFQMKPKDKKVKSSREPIILQHGILVDGRSWFMSGNSSLGFKLVNKGFDLWMPNFRGTTFSKTHVNKKDEKDYWNYSFHELGIYDITAIVEYVANFTKRNDISYIGHSMGTTAFTVYATEKPEHAKKYIKQAIFLAPVVNFFHPPVAIKLALQYVEKIKNIFESLKVYAIGNLTNIQRIFAKLLCGSYPWIVGCHIVMSLIAGVVIQQLRTDIIPLLVQFFPTAISVKTLEHYAQIYHNNGIFQHYDYGAKNNMNLYNSKMPPIYDIDKLKVPITIFAGNHDTLSEIRDVYRLYDSIKTPKEIHNYDLAHLDYMYGKDVVDMYNDIIKVLKKDY